MSGEWVNAEANDHLQDMRCKRQRKPEDMHRQILEKLKACVHGKVERCLVVLPKGVSSVQLSSDLPRTSRDLRHTLLESPCKTRQCASPLDTTLSLNQSVSHRGGCGNSPANRSCLHELIRMFLATRIARVPWSMMRTLAIPTSLPRKINP
jgi:hypothetical protein